MPLESFFSYQFPESLQRTVFYYETKGTFYQTQFLKKGKEKEITSCCTSSNFSCFWNGPARGSAIPEIFLQSLWRTKQMPCWRFPLSPLVLFHTDHLFESALILEVHHVRHTEFSLRKNRSWLISHTYPTISRSRRRGQEGWTDHCQSTLA